MKVIYRVKFGRFWLLLIVLLSTITTAFPLTHIPSKVQDRTWMLDEHIKMTIDILENAPFTWKNEKAKMIVIFSNLYCDLWDINHASVNQIPDFPNISIPIIDGKYPYSNADTIIMYGQPNYSDFANYWLADTNFNKYLPPLPSADKIISESPGFHFDNLFTFEMIEQRWSMFDDWLIKNGKEIQENKSIKYPVQYWLGVIGLVLHAVQDFYCHSNWVLLTGYFGYDKPTLEVEELPIWEEFFDTNWIKTKNFNFQKVLHEFRQSNEIKGVNKEIYKIHSIYIPNGGLQTGNVIQVNKLIPDYNDYFKFPIGENNIPWRHRHPGEREKENFGKAQNKAIKNIFNDSLATSKEKITALELSKRASKTWLSKMINPKLIGKMLYDSFITYIDTVDNRVYNDCDSDEFVRDDFWR